MIPAHISPVHTVYNDLAYFDSIGRKLPPIYLQEWVLAHFFLATLASWPAAWIGSDLLSLRFPANPDPLRQWWPVEFLARFVGRFVPLLGIVSATAFAVSWLPVRLYGLLPVVWYHQ